MLIPNRHYYEIYDTNQIKPVKSQIDCVKSYGLTYAVDGLLNELGLIEIMKKKFPELADQIIALAEYMLCEGNVMNYYEDWHDEAYPPTQTSSLDRLILVVYSKQ